MDGTRTVTMPKLGLTMTEGLLAEWRAAPGAAFRAGDVLFVVETDKIANEIEADADGVLVETLVSAGETVPVGAELARIRPPQAGSADPSPADPAPVAAAASRDPAPAARVVATPLARRIAREHGLDLRDVVGSGPRGRIKAEDVRLAHAVRREAPEDPPGPAAGPEVAPAPARAPAQAAVARRMVEAKRDIPHFYVARDVDVGALLELRAQVAREGAWGPTTLTHWVVAAVGRALVERPEANRVWEGSGAVRLAAPDVGLAVDGEHGLFAPVIRDAGRKSVGAVAADARRLADAARQGRLIDDAPRGCAVTVSNAGPGNVSYLTPIVSPGQTFVLGLGAVRPAFRPDADGRPRLCRELGVVLACDHRVINGREAAGVLDAIAGLLEAPLRLLTLPAGNG